MNRAQALSNLFRQPSPQQHAIYDWFARGRGNLAVRARAGTGKTSTLLEGINHAPERSILLAAFNKRIADELKTRLKNRRAQAKTLHSVGYASIRSRQPAQLDEDRGHRIAEELVAGPVEMVHLVQKLAAVAKNAAPFAKHEDLLALADDFDLEPDPDWQEEGWHTADIAALALKAMNRALEPDGTVDFDDMVFVPVCRGWVRPRFDLVVIDEAQDMSATQIEICRRSVLPGGRIAVIGDDRQAIYGFRGADSTSLDRLKHELRAAELPLTVTFRCPRLVVEQAQRLVPDFEAAANAPLGELVEMTAAQMYAAASPGDFILSRKNAPLVRVCLTLIVAGKRAMIEGRDIGQGLIALIRRLRAATIEDLIAGVERWRNREIQKYRGNTSKKAAAKLEQILDAAAALTVLAEASDSVGHLERRIEALFQETGGKRQDVVVCSSVHKAKGLERDRVFGLMDTLYPGGRDDMEERNVHYVLLTRAKKTFVKVIGTDGGLPAAPAPEEAANG
jgi:superfamily I DNA/RNA helicase